MCVCARVSIRVRKDNSANQPWCPAYSDVWALVGGNWTETGWGCILKCPHSVSKEGTTTFVWYWTGSFFSFFLLNKRPWDQNTLSNSVVKHNFQIFGELNKPERMTVSLFCPSEQQGELTLIATRFFCTEPQFVIQLVCYQATFAESEQDWIWCSRGNQCTVNTMDFMVVIREIYVAALLFIYLFFLKKLILPVSDIFQLLTFC